MLRRLVVIGLVGWALFSGLPRPAARSWLPTWTPASATAAPAPGLREVWARPELARPRGAHTGADIAAALAECKPGCVLRLLPARYEDVAIDIGPGFADGQLAIIGSGKGRTVLQMRTDVPDHVIDVGPGAPRGLEIADFTIDGRKDLQRPSKRKPDISQMAGIYVADKSARNFLDLHVHDLEIRNVVYAGIRVFNADRFVIEKNDISDIGCNQHFTPCGTKLPAPNPWNGQRDVLPTAVDTKAVGFAILVGGDTHDGIVRRNRAARTTKYAMGIYTNGELCGSPGEARNITFEDNVVQDAATGIVLNGGCYSTVRRNRVSGSGRLLRTCPGGCTSYYGFASGTDNEGNVWESNVARENLGSGFHLGGNGPGGKITIVDNQSIDNCLLGDVYAYYDYSIRYPGGFHRRYPGVVFRNNRAVHTKPTKCRWAVTFAARSDIVMEGGSYAAGTEGGVKLEDGSGIDMRNLSIVGDGSPVGIWIGRDFRKGRIWPSVAITGRIGRDYVNERSPGDAERVRVDVPAPGSASAAVLPAPILLP